MSNIVSCSFGKDSLATVILAKLNNVEIDEIIFSEVMFSHKEKISGENPDHIEFIYNVAIPKLKKWGYKVTVLKSKKDYLDCFFHKVTRGKRKGQFAGFPLGGLCVINRDLKVKPIIDYLKKHKNVIQYIGIAIDEEDRLKALHKRKGQISLLEKYNYTEQMAYDLCKEYDLLSPIYKYSTRGGCWFCPNIKIKEMKNLRQKFNHLWSRLLSLDNTPNLAGVYKYGNTVQFYENRFEQEEKQLKLF